MKHFIYYFNKFLVNLILGKNRYGPLPNFRMFFTQRKHI